MCIRNCVRTANANSIDVSRYCCWQSMHVSVWPTALGNNNIMTWLSFRISSNNNNSQIPFALEQLTTALHMNLCSLSLISILNRVGHTKLYIWNKVETVGAFEPNVHKFCALLAKLYFLFIHDYIASIVSNPCCTVRTCTFFLYTSKQQIDSITPYD